ncbi:hypothetical protein TBLA_0B01770 [Henningerozyma blattae CBS 6284]|uniref:Uncharacterized protein n=1 Tax=Henningerozyma blattae (strain ATCC 34711 / CBS 6284 / DSM 70876 / NBRC 10599 / NRRL Y-10934 / UCD 77-7) TaxID=1071380 RepID=I2GY18_HENB6|nr:hypothetical protein TBLA_0B01770 [Tetrapisispora blattae CBS 6284]CCH59020.1 hypothetical protein TBLA_0B01770 [Tetrapisispora blattae CBS 6284]
MEDQISKRNKETRIMKEDIEKNDLSKDDKRNKIKRRGGMKKYQRWIIILISLSISIFFVIPYIKTFTFGFNGKMEEGKRLHHWIGRGYKYQRVEDPILNEDHDKAKGVLLSVVFPHELNKFIRTMQTMEDSFNVNFNYDWLILSNETFHQRDLTTLRGLASGKIQFGLIPEDEIRYPTNTDKKKMEKNMEKFVDKKVPFAKSMEMRQKNRYFSKFFYKHALLQPYDYFWRVDPDAVILCKIDYDVFRFMKDNNKTFGFISGSHTYAEVVDGLWNVTSKFMNNHPQLINKNNLIKFVKNDKDEFNRCQFLTNWEIASFKMFRNDKYEAYSAYLESLQGFFNELWPDNMVHTLFASIYLDREELYHFKNMGFDYNPFRICPIENEILARERCGCFATDDFTWHRLSCIPQYYELMGLTKKAPVSHNNYG